VCQLAIVNDGKIDGPGNMGFAMKTTDVWTKPACAAQAYVLGIRAIRGIRPGDA
jgi:hypothetical protein